MEFPARTRREPDYDRNRDLELFHSLLLCTCTLLRQRGLLLLIWVLPTSVDHCAWAWELRTTEARVGA